jgi:hypothetical protein
MTQLAPVYIPPLATVHSTFPEAEAAIERGGLPLRSRDKERVDVPTIVLGKRSLIVGEPGVGKSVMMEKIAERLRAERVEVTTIALRAHDAVDRISAVAGEMSREARHALLLDGLDETPARLLNEVLETVSEFALAHPHIAVFISGRWVFAKRYAHLFWVRIDRVGAKQHDSGRLIGGRLS